MRPGLIPQLLEAHRALGSRDGARTDRDGWSLAADHVACGPRAGTLVFAAFAALDRPVLGASLTLVCLGRGTHQGFEDSDQTHHLVSAARRYGATLSRAGNGGCDPVYRDRFGAPGRLLVGAGEFAPSSGALGMLSLRATELEVAAALGGVPFEVEGRTCVLSLAGGLASWVTGHDLALEIERRLPALAQPGVLLEIAGPGVQSLTMADRIAVASRLGGSRVAAVVFPSDEITHLYLRALGRDADWKPLGPVDAGKSRDAELDLDLIEPNVRSADDPGSSRPVRQVKGIEVRRIVLGPQAAYADLARAAWVLAGRHTHPSVELVVIPGSRGLIETARANGVLDTLVAAGARVVEGESTTGPSSASALRAVGLCFGAAPERLADGRTVWLIASAETCAASALHGRLSDPRELETEFRRDEEPERYVIADGWIEKPSPAGTHPGSAARVARVPAGRPLDQPLRGAVLLELGERVLAEDVLPWGARLEPIATRIDALAHHAFSRLDSDFVARARRHGGGFVVAGRDLGLGPQREQAVLALVELGVRAVMARSFDPEFLHGLLRAGVLPLRFRFESDARALRAGDELEIPGLPESLEAGKAVLVRNLTRGTQYTLPHDLRPHEIGLVRAGGLLALARED